MAVELEVRWLAMDAARRRSREGGGWCCVPSTACCTASRSRLAFEVECGVKYEDGDGVVVEKRSMRFSSSCWLVGCGWVVDGCGAAFGSWPLKMLKGSVGSAMVAGR